MALLCRKDQPAKLALHKAVAHGFITLTNRHIAPSPLEELPHAQGLREIVADAQLIVNKIQLGTDLPKLVET